MLRDMVDSPGNQIKIKYAKYLSWLYMIAALSIYLAGRIKFWMPEYAHMDFMKYKSMSEASPDLSPDIIQPFAYRILAPWITGLLPFRVEISFYILTVISLFFLVYLLFNFLIKNNIEHRIAFALTSAFIFNRYFFQFPAWDYFHVSDLLAMCAMLLFLIKLFEKNWIYLAILAIPAVLIKETFLILIPVSYIYLYITRSTKKEYAWITLITIISIGAFIGVRLFVQTPGGETLWEQFSSGLVYFFNFESFVKKVVLAFLPFGLVPLIYYKHSYTFLKTNSHYLLFFVIVLMLSFFGDAERLMMPFAPVYYTLIGYIIQQFLSESTNKSYLRKFLLYIMLTAFLSSFYHLWGVIQLPAKVYSLVSALLLSAVTGYLFWRLKILKKEKPA